MARHLPRPGASPLILNGAFLLLDFILSPATFKVFDPIHGPDLKTFCLGVAVVSVCAWCAAFAIWHRVNRPPRRIRKVENETVDLWDRWLDGPG
jgi:hypothetical protein